MADTIPGKRGDEVARRKRQSGAEDIMDLVALLPWWAGVALAFVTYVVFHALANRPPPPMTSPNQIGSAFPTILIAGLALAAQYVVPPLCVLGAAISFARRRKREALVRNATESRTADALTDMSWQEFEQLVGEGFRLQGYTVREQGGAKPDGGVDVILQRGRETFLVQCKQWRAFKVGVDVVRELYGVMAARGAAGGFVVTSGQFTDDAREFAEGRNVRLIDGPKLMGLLQQARTSLAGSAPQRPEVDKRPPALNEIAPSCPICSSAMVRRTAKQGAKAGSQFWGCSTFPRCRGTR